MGKKSISTRTRSRMIYKSTILVVILILSLSSLMIFVNAVDDSSQENLYFTFKFSEPNLKDIFLNNKTFTQISINNCLSHGQPGDPSLPLYPIKILIPQGKKVKDISIVDSHSQDIDYSFLEKPVFPEQNPISIGLDNENITFLINDTAYNSSEPVVDYPFRDQYISYCRGYKILTLTLNPVQYYPSEGRLEYYPEMNLKLDLENDNSFNTLFREKLDDKEWVEKLVFNPQETNTYSQSNFGQSFEYTNGLCDPSDEYEYIIITTTHNGLDDWPTDETTPYNWTSLMNHHRIYDNYNCTIVTIENISNCTDYWNTNSLYNDTPAKIREFCKDAYQDWKAQYVLIGGDDEIIPARELYYDYPETVDSDLYWSNLDSSFNEDADGIWGEPGDGGFDLYSELYIGRVTCDVPQDVSNWLKKSFTYDFSNDTDYLDNAAFFGGNSGWPSECDDFIDFSAIKGTSDWLGPIPDYYGDFPSWVGYLYGFETWNSENPTMQYDLSVKWTVESPNTGWQGGDSTAITSFRNAINSDSVTLISGIAHADEDMSLSVSKTTWESDYHNTLPFFIYDYGCHCGDMDAADDGVLHSMLFHSDTELAFACIYNTGYGWGAYYSTNSSSALLQKLFWDYIFDLENNSVRTSNWQLGKAHAFSKDAMAPTLNWSRGDQWRGILEGCLLFGDPAQKLRAPVLEQDITISNENPTNQSENLSRGLKTLQATFTDSENDLLNIFFRTNASGTWEDIGSNNSQLSGTYSQVYNFNEFGQNYFWSVNVSDTTGLSGWKNETYQFSTRPIHNVTAPTSFTATKINKTRILLTWTQGENATNTYIERNTSSSWAIGQGTQIYNGTESSFINNSLTPNTVYYYQAWCWDSQDNAWSSLTSSSYNNTNNSLPIINTITPINGSVDQSLYQNLSVNVTEADNELMNVTFYTNKTGSWELIGYNESSSNGTYYQMNISFENYSRKYWWSVNITDGINWTNATYYFKTVDNYVTQLSQISPANRSTSVSISITNITLTATDLEGDLFNWTIETYPEIGNNSGINSSSGTIFCNISNISYSSTYHWNLSIIDQGNATWINNTYWFTTQSQPSDNNPNPSGGPSGPIVLNSAPDIPSTPSGVIKGYVDTSYTFSTQTNDTNENQIRYLFDWGDGTNSSWSDLVDSGEIYSSSHIWNNIGTYNVKSKAKDSAGLQSDWSDNLTISIFSINNQPINNTNNDSNNQNKTIEVVKNFNSNDSFNFSLLNISVYEDENLTYYWDFGDGNISTEKNPNHKFSKPGIYLVTVNVYDENGTLIKQETYEITINDETESSTKDISKKTDNALDLFWIGIIILGGIIFILFYYRKSLYNYFKTSYNLPHKSKNVNQTKYDNYYFSPKKPRQYYFKSSCNYELSTNFTKNNKFTNNSEKKYNIHKIRDFIDNLEKNKELNRYKDKKT